MRRLLVFSLALVVIIADQTSKIWAVKYLSLGRVLVIFPRYVELAYTTNTGAAFGMFHSATLVLGFIALVTGIGIALYVLYFCKGLNTYKIIAIGLILGGALGNFVDRFRLHYVVDFIDIHLGSYQWPVFNVADSAICVGVALLAIRYATVRSSDTHISHKQIISSNVSEPSAASSE